MTHHLTRPSSFLRRALRSNAIFSALSGAALVVFSAPLAVRLGVGYQAVLVAIGASLLAFSAGLAWNASRERVSRKEAWLAVVLDLGWVVVSVAVIALQILSRAGNWAVAVVADIVLVLALLQIAGLRRLERANRV